MTAATTVAAPLDAHGSASQWSGAVLLFDDRCSVCRRFVSFVTGVDHGGRLRIAPLESLFGDTIRRTHAEFSNRDSALFVRGDGTILAYSDAVIASLEQVGGIWRHLAHALQRVPRHLRDRAYTAFANHRSLFGAFGLAQLDDTSSSRMPSDNQHTDTQND